MSGRLAGKVALITGAGQGIGRAAAIAFAAEGAKVCATDKNPASLEKFGPGVNARAMDVTDEAGIRLVATEAATELGDIDILFNCAGWVHQGTILDCTPKDWDICMNVNVRSMYLVTRAFLPGMLKKKKGSIINMASAVAAQHGVPNRFAYGTSKAAVMGFTRAVAADYVRQGVRCNAVCPGTIDTPSLQERINALSDPVKARKDFIERQPMGRLGTVDDITPLLVYLASDESSFATGAMFSVDGGMTI